MIFRNVSGITGIALALVGCAGDSGSSAPPPAENTRPALELTFTDAPVDLTNSSADFAADVRYGDAERNVFDIYLPDCADPTPLVIYIHGGGFTTGDKRTPYIPQDDNIRTFLQNCVAFASINYTLLDIPEEGSDLTAAIAQGGVQAPLRDTARALQFMRYHYESLNIEVENVAVYGVSAGAGSGLWLGTRDDMAEPENEDPVLRESTRVKAVGALSTQSTYDIPDWEEVLLPITEPFAALLGGTDVASIAETIGATSYLLTILATDSVDALDSPDTVAYRAEVDMLEQMDSGDAPIYVRNFATSADDLLDLLLHHALHAFALKNRADAVGLASVVYSEDPNFPLEDPSGESVASFLMRHIL